MVGNLSNLSKVLMNKPTAPRAYYLDWMRITVIYCVVFYHTMDGLNWAHLFALIPGFTDRFVVFKAAALQMGMPMVFNVSGRAQGISRPASFSTVITERAKRLLVPCAVAYVLLIPPWQFVDLEYDYGNPGIWHMRDSFLQWYASYWTRGGFIEHFDMAWLWFLPALYFITFMSTPLFLVAERRETCKNLIVTCILWLMLVWLIKVAGFSCWFMLFTLIGTLGPLLLAQMVPLPTDAVISNSALLRVLLAHNVIAVGSQVAMAQSFKYKDIDPHGASWDLSPSQHSPFVIVPMVLFSLSMYIHGYFQQRWESGLREIQTTWWTMLGKAIFAFSITILFTLCTPMGDVEDGHFIYPVYSASYWRGTFFGSMYVLGTFAYLAAFTGFSMAHLNEAGSPEFHRHATKSTLVVYIVHWAFVKIITFLMIRPTLVKYGLVKSVTKPWMGFAMVLGTFAVVVACSLGFYALLVCRFPTIGKLFGL